MRSIIEHALHGQLEPNARFVVKPTNAVGPHELDQHFVWRSALRSKATGKKIIEKIELHRRKPPADTFDLGRNPANARPSETDR